MPAATADRLRGGDHSSCMNYGLVRGPYYEKDILTEADACAVAEKCRALG
jgi:hypothetical protein